jgi:hypothetical protein
MNQVRNISDADQVKKNNKQIEIKVMEEDRDLAWMLSHPQGRRLIWKWIAECNIYNAGFEQSGSALYYKEGARNFGVKLLANVTRVNPEAYLQMIKENNEEIGK